MAWFSDWVQGLKDLWNGGPPSEIAPPPVANGTIPSGGRNFYPDTRIQAPNPSLFANPNDVSPPASLPTSQLPQATNPFDTNSYLNQLYMAQLSAIQQNAPQMPSTAEILKQAKKQANSQYNPQIQALLREMSREKHRNKSVRKDMDALWDEVRASYGPEAKKSNRRYSQAAASEKERFNALKNDLASSYAETQNEQADEFGQLGIDAAIPAASQQQTEDLAYIDKVIAADNNSQLQSLQSQGAGNLDFLQQSASIAGLRGAEAQQDLANQLANYLSEASASLGDLKAQRLSAIEQLKQQKSWDQMFKMMNFYNTVMNQQTQNQNSQQSGSNSYRNLSGAMKIATDSMGANGAQLMQPFYELMMSSREIQDGRYKSGPDYVNLTPQKAAAIARNFARERKFNDQMTTTFVNMMLAYMGKY
jgi:hypothetical protein